MSNEEWKKILSPDLYAVAREAATERPFTGKYNETDELGEYYCAVCGNHLFAHLQNLQVLADGLASFNLKRCSEV